MWVGCQWVSAPRLWTGLRVLAVRLALRHRKDLEAGGGGDLTVLVCTGSLCVCEGSLTAGALWPIMPSSAQPPATSTKGGWL